MPDRNEPVMTIISVEDNFIDQQVVRKTGLALNPPAFLSSIIRHGPCDDVWFLPRAPSSLTFGRVLLNPRGCERLDAGVTLAVELKSPLGPGLVDVDEAEAAIGWGRIALDVVRRDVPSEQAFLARSYPTHTPISPTRTPWCGMPPPKDCVLRLIVNGALRQHSTLTAQRASAATLLTQIARSTRLQPGDIVLTGTPHGVAFDGSGQWLTAGDAIVASGEGLGQLEMTVEEEQPT